MSWLHILNINALLVISFANIFSHSVSCFFVLSIVSFAVQKLLSLIRSHMFIFAFLFFALGDRPKNKNYYDISKNVLPSSFSSTSFMVSGLTFRSLIPFEFIFVYGVRKFSNFLYLHVCSCQVFPAPLTEEPVFSPIVYSWLLLWNNWLYGCGFISGLSILFCWSMCLLFVLVLYWLL